MTWSSCSLEVSPFIGFSSCTFRPLKAERRGNLLSSMCMARDSSKLWTIFYHMGSDVAQDAPKPTCVGPEAQSFGSRTSLTVSATSAVAAARVQYAVRLRGWIPSAARSLASSRSLSANSPPSSSSQLVSLSPGPAARECSNRSRTAASVSRLTSFGRSRVWVWLLNFHVDRPCSRLSQSIVRSLRFVVANPMKDDVDPRPSSYFKLSSQAVSIR
jgi:hypothetical protein